MGLQDLDQSELDFDASAALEDPNARAIYSVSQLNAEVRDLLENGFPLLWVEGELSNLARPGSGHWYFTLKDERAQVRCAMFRGRNRLVDFRPQDGGQILVRARVGLYEPRGSYQLIVEHMEPAGDGALRRAFDQLKNKLQSEGLFDPEHKQTLPPVPRRIGVITSGTGAAVRDVLSILRRRFPLGDVLIFPVPVQGEAAAPAIVGALERAARHGGCDVLIVTRGGGSLEDLWAFNEEAVARAIHACPLPVVSAVGHEVDFTIADFAADVRAPTPSAAAETVSPDQGEWQARLSALEKTLQQRQARRLGQAKRDMERLGKRLDRLRPDHRLQQHMQRLDELETRLHRAVKFVRESRGTSLHQARTRLINASPARTIAAAGERRQALARRLTAVQRQLLQQKQSRMREAWRALHTVSPLATLERGYAIASDGEGRIVRDAASVAPGDALQLRLHRGRLDVSVTTSHAGADLGEDEPKG